MLSISRTLRRISSQIQSLSKKHPHWHMCHRSSHGKTVKFYAIDSIYYTHSSTEYDRSPSEDISTFDDQDIDDEDDDFEHCYAC
ncbi:hypothetical protein G6F70_004821 [Rhizopus microsporus]|nr:hypothetical protein G6F71_004432 [Rhizopus microsporus]KAG1199547.1 hypothetical protein G6F70_004821 [Rhizopus microsporus]KAG1211327.1 hypothetical protein G6F69_004683 [Rhizopus microsporus]KAG1233274.1 hypothetical protein G6F67_004399 [Rhizopus microsporus]KAG1267949.1 hypothetical protein G6F68_001501 [Rhizopus microsporus]